MAAVRAERAGADHDRVRQVAQQRHDEAVGVAVAPQRPPGALRRGERGDPVQRRDHVGVEHVVREREVAAVERGERRGQLAAPGPVEEGTQRFHAATLAEMAPDGAVR